MNRIFITIIISYLVMLTTGCTNEFEGWHSISVENIGTFKIPQECVVTQQENILYVTDKPIEDEDGYKLYMIGSIDTENDDYKDISVLRLFDNIGDVELLSSAVLSNGVIYALDKISIEDQDEYRYHFSIRGNAGYHLYVYYWEEHIEKDLAYKIAKSFQFE